MNKKLRQRARNLKRRIERRLRPIDWEDQDRPMISASNAQYEVAKKTRGIDVGGIIRSGEARTPSSSAGRSAT